MDFGNSTLKMELVTCIHTTHTFNTYTHACIVVPLLRPPRPDHLLERPIYLGTNVCFIGLFPLIGNIIPLTLLWTIGWSLKLLYHTHPHPHIYNICTHTALTHIHTCICIYHVYIHIHGICVRAHTRNRYTHMYWTLIYSLAHYSLTSCLLILLGSHEKNGSRKWRLGRSLIQLGYHV